MRAAVVETRTSPSAARDVEARSSTTGRTRDLTIANERRLGRLAFAWATVGLLVSLLVVATGPDAAFHGGTLVQLLTAAPAAFYTGRYVQALRSRRSR